MINLSKHTALVAIITLLAVISSPAHPADITVGASVNMKSAISATKGQDMNFGNVNFDPTHSGLIQLATNGTVNLSGGASGLSLSGGSPTAGDVTIGGDGQSIIEVSCENNGQLNFDGTNSLNLQDVQFSIDNGQAFGAATPCSGVNVTSTIIDLGANASPKLLFGGALDVSGNAITTSGEYRTASASGDPVTVRVVYQ